MTVKILETENDNDMREEIQARSEHLRTFIAP